MKTFQDNENELVPPMGNCKTIEGEMIRAIMKIEYRLFNDGDVPCYGYGMQTSGPAAAFLMQCPEIPANIREEACELDTDNKTGVKNTIEVLKGMAVDYINSLNGELTKNNANIDMLTFELPENHCHGEIRDDDYDYENEDCYDEEDEEIYAK